jgi:sialic acid synthase SpsE
MANYDDVKMVVDLFEELNFKKYSLLVCTSAYPAPLNEVNLNKILTLKSITKNKIIGFSDHTENNYSSMIAVGLGARIFEKHFTLDKNYPGPDHRFSMNPEELKDWVNSINLSFSIIGSKEITPTNKEIEMLKIARRSITAIKQIRKGELFTMENIGLRRPSNGLPPSKFETLLNKKAKRNFKIGEKIFEKDF